MTERTSKTKVDENGNPKTYFAHVGPDDKFCFGVGKPAAGDYKETVEEIDKKEDVQESKEIQEANRAFLEEDNGVSESTGQQEGPMTKAEWRAKDDIIRRLTLAKQYIGAAIDFDNAVKTGDLLKWDHWTKTGNLPGPHAEEK
jgi:hypothetical protein